MTDFPKFINPRFTNSTRTTHFVIFINYLLKIFPWYFPPILWPPPGIDFLLSFSTEKLGRQFNLACGKAWRNRVLVTDGFKNFSWLYYFVISHASLVTSSVVTFWGQRKASKVPHLLMVPLGWRWMCETVVEPEAWWPPSRSREASSSYVFDPWRSKTGRCSVRWPGAGYHWNLGRWGGIRAAHWARPSPQDYPTGCGCAPWLRNPPPYNPTPSWEHAKPWKEQVQMMGPEQKVHEHYRSSASAQNKDL